MGGTWTGRSGVAAVVVGLLLAAMPLPVAAQDERPTGPPRRDRPAGLPILDRSGPRAVFVELAAPAAAAAYDRSRARGRTAARAAARDAAAGADERADEVLAAARRLDGDAVELYRTRNAIAGIALVAEGGALAALEERDDVVSVRVLRPKTIENASAAALTRTLQSWQDLGRTGTGIDIGIIDTGIDFTHADFGGPGTAAAYDGIDPTDASGVFPTTKVASGRDFAGDAYNASSDDPAQYTPVPDDNPLDCHGHGTHVAGTAAGSGVNADGSTFEGQYSNLTPDDLLAMRVAPGTAPTATLHALKVFGCDGSTGLLGAALDWALDPNGDSDPSDHLDVVNISLGSSYSTPDDPDALLADELMDAGVMLVFSAGNGGDFYDIGGESPKALSVASTLDGYELLDGAEVTAPAGLAGVKPGQYGVLFDMTGLDRTRDVVALNPTDPVQRDGCTAGAFASAPVAGKYVWLEWDDDNATRRCGSLTRAENASDAGADGVILTSGLAHFSAGINGNTRHPTFQLTGPATDALRPSLEAGTLRIRLAEDLVQSVPSMDPAIADTPSGFTSRGTRTPVVKPDIAAPGDTIASASMGSGTGAAVFSGTSMAAPHTAGIAALVRQANPGWSTAEVKAALMNGSVDVFVGNGQTGPRMAPNRVGAGRVDARSALGTEVLAAWHDDPALVSVGFGVVEAAGDLQRTEQVRLTNKGAAPATFAVSYSPVTTTPGASVAVSPATVTVPAGGTTTVDVTLTVSRSSLRKVGDPTVQPLTFFGSTRQFLSDISGTVRFTPTAGATEDLRVPVYAAPKPVSRITVPDSLALHPGTGLGSLALGGSGLDQGSGVQRYRALMSVMQLLAESPELPDCGETGLTGCIPNATAKGGDLRYVGAASSAPQAVADGTPEDAALGVGIATWGDWANVGRNTIPFVEIDVDQDGDADFQTIVVRSVGTDLLEAATFALSGAFPMVAIEPINEHDGAVDTNTFDTNVLVIPIPLQEIGIDPSGPADPVDLFVGVAGYYTAPNDWLVDSTHGALTFDPVHPELWTESVDGPTLVQRAQVGTTRTVHGDLGALDGTESLLVLGLHNGAGQRASVVPVVPPPVGHVVVDGTTSPDDDLRVTEGDAGTRVVTFTVRRTTASFPYASSVAWSTRDVAATAADDDYEAGSGVLDFAPGQDTATVSVTVNGDRKRETSERFQVVLRPSSANAVVAGPCGTDCDGDGIGYARVVNDDPVPKLSVVDAARLEGHTGTPTVAVTVKLDRPTYRVVDVDFLTAAGTATAGSDYVTRSGTAHFPPGQTTAVVTLTLKGDRVREPDETFQIRLRNAVSATIADGTGVITIRNDD